MSRQRHPDTEQIATLAAGPISGFRARRLAAHVAGCERCAAVSDQLGAMRSLLASVPSAAMPGAFERQISAAIATEAAGRAAEQTPAGVGATRDQADPGSAEPVKRSPRHRHARSRGERSFRLRPAMAFIPVAACLIAAFGYLASRPGTSTSSGPETNAAAPLREPANPAAAGTGASASASASQALGKSEPEAQSPPAFTVVESGTRYQASRLRAQVRGELKSVTFSTIVPSAVPSTSYSAAASASGGGAVPSAGLVGCVLRVTGGASPQLVDKAVYQGEPVYVIALHSKAWVVGRGCTAAHSELITSASLTTAP